LAEQVKADQSRVPLFTYYSFVTLTTVGYGDVTPVSTPARTCAWLEALTGQFYLAGAGAELTRGSPASTSSSGIITVTTGSPWSPGPHTALSRTSGGRLLVVPATRLPGCVTSNRKKKYHLPGGRYHWSSKPRQSYFPAQGRGRRRRAFPAATLHPVAARLRPLARGPLHLLA
jgi:hypothetical protein